MNWLGGNIFAFFLQRLVSSSNKNHASILLQRLPKKFAEIMNWLGGNIFASFLQRLVSSSNKNHASILLQRLPKQEQCFDTEDSAGFLSNDRNDGFYYLIEGVKWVLQRNIISFVLSTVGH